MEIQRVAAASTFVTFPMLSNTGVPQTGLSVTGTWLAWADTAGPNAAGNPGFRTLSGAITEVSTTGIYANALASTELPAASPFVLLRYIAAGVATQYLLVRTATFFVNVQAITANAITATAIAADAITDAKVASDVTIASVTGSVGSVAGNVDGSVASIGTGGITSGSFAAGAIDASAIAANAIGASEIADGAIDAGAIATGAIDADALAADAVAEIADGVWDEVIYGAHQTDNTAGKVMQRMYHATDYLVASVLSGSTYADDFLGRNLHRGSSGGRTVAQALMALRNKVSISAGTLTVTGEDDTTAEWTATIATQAVSAIVTSIDPA